MKSVNFGVKKISKIFFLMKVCVLVVKGIRLELPKLKSVVCLERPRPKQGRFKLAHTRISVIREYPTGSSLCQWSSPEVLKFCSITTQRGRGSDRAIVLGNFQCRGVLQSAIDRF